MTNATATPPTNPERISREVGMAHSIRRSVEIRVARTSRIVYWSIVMAAMVVGIVTYLLHWPIRDIIGYASVFGICAALAFVGLEVWRHKMLPQLSEKDEGLCSLYKEMLSLNIGLDLMINGTTSIEEVQIMVDRSVGDIIDGLNNKVTREMDSTHINEFKKEFKQLEALARYAPSFIILPRFPESWKPWIDAIRDKADSEN